MPVDLVNLSPGWINERFKKLERAIEGLRSERRTAATTISAGGTLLVDGGDVVMLDTDGSVMFRLGVQPNGDRGFFIARDDGSLAFAVRKPFANTAQSIEIRDRLGYILLAEEALGSGLSKPFLHLPLTPVMAAPTTLQHGPYGPEVPVTATTFTTTHRAWLARHNQYGRLMLQVAASDTTTAAEIQVVDAATGTPLGDLLQPAWLGTRAAGSAGYVQVDPPRLYLPGAPDDRISVAVQVRRTAGTGTLRVAVPESHGA